MTKLSSETNQIVYSKGLRNIFLSLMGLVILAVIVYYLYVNAKDYFHLLQVSPTKLAIIGLLAVAVPAGNGFINLYLFQTLRVNLSLRESVYLAASTTLANQLPFPGGMISRGLYLKHRHGLSYASYLSASLALFFCMLSASGFIGLAILGYWFLFKTVSVPLPLTIGFACMAAGVLVFWAPFARMKLPGKIGAWTGQAVEGWTMISHNPRLLYRLVGLQTILMLTFAVRQWLAFQMLSQNIAIDQAILLASGIVLTQVVNFAPGGLGVTEVIVGGIASALGFDFTVSIAAIELDRLASTLVIVLTGLFGTIMLGKEISKNSPDPQIQPESK
jgi:uncharacterized membrane protein YbhN (UPF0104 family)